SRSELHDAGEMRQPDAPAVNAVDHLLDPRYRAALEELDQPADVERPSKWQCDYAAISPPCCRCDSSFSR
ncbi:MAG TPA: hypothetical protein VGX45_16390, partial [Solirubrobacteraceae bacterium]|nr:hypothetical protein [Solirubrobacteraceae bacterium]